MIGRISSFGAVSVFLAVFGLRLLPIAAQEKTPAAGNAVATVNGKSITEEELNRAAAADLEKLEMQRMQSEANFTRGKYQILEDTLKRMVEERLLDAEAARRGITRADLLAGEVDKKIKEPTPDEVTKFYEANKGRITAPKEQVLPQIHQYLRQQSGAKARADLIERLKKTQKVALSLQPYRVELSAAGHPSRGPANAPITIIEFSDFQCNFCKDFSLTLGQVLTEFKGDARMVFRQLPLVDIHPLAQKAAEASLCAEEQGRFWEMHDLMFKDQANLKVEDLKTKAASLGLDAKAFGACLDSGRFASRVRADLREAARCGASGTPATFINGRFLNGARPYAEIVAIIKEELQNRASAPAKR